MKYKFIFFLLIFSCIFYLLGPIKNYKSFELTPTTSLNADKPAGEIVNGFAIKQPIKITNNFLKIIDIYRDDAPLCVELFMANYNNRKNSGSFEVKLTNSNKTVRSILDANSIKDNEWKNICFEDLTLGELSNGTSILSIKGLNSPPGEAVTAWLTSDATSRKSTINQKKSNGLIYKLSTKEINNAKFISFSILVLLLAAFMTLLEKKFLTYKSIILFFQDDFKTIHIAYTLTALPLLLMLTYFNPAFQSPDEHSHVKKSYMIATGQLKITSPREASSGGYVDSNLLTYISLLRRIQSDRESLKNMKSIHEAKELYFSGNNIFVQSPGAAYYAPIIYMPQALVMRISMWLGASIDNTYKSIRLFNILLVVLISSFSLKMLPIGKEFALFVLLLPMTLSQMSSAIIDGYIFSLSLSLWALFSYALIISNHWNLKYSITSWGVLGILISVRPSFVVFGLLFLYIELYRKHYKGLIIMTLTALGVIWWSYYSISNVIDTRIQRPIDTIGTFKIFLHDPSVFLKPFFNTLTIEHLIDWYYKPFIGVLGFLDTPLPTWLYQIATLFLFITLIILALKQSFLMNSHKVMLLAIITTSSILTFFLLWLSWTNMSSDIIEGVQGRYFIPMSFAFGLIASGSLSRFIISNNFLNAAFKIIFFIWVCILYIQLPITLVNKFW